MGPLGQAPIRSHPLTGECPRRVSGSGRQIYPKARNQGGVETSRTRKPTPEYCHNIIPGGQGSGGKVPQGFASRTRRGREARHPGITTRA